ncbi:MAG: hypothetical protein ACE5GL_10335 [Calditrichia bacterium]
MDYRTAIVVVSLSFFLWLVVKMNRAYDYAYDIPLKIVNDNPGKCLKYPVPETVTVEFRGTGWELLWLNFRNVICEINLSDVQDKMLINLSEHPEFVRFPEGVSVPVKSIIRPQQLVVELDDLAEKIVPLQPNYQLVTTPGYTLISVVPRPDSIGVLGPATYVDTLSHILTKMRKFKDVMYPFETEFEVKKNTEFFANYIPEKLKVAFDVQPLAEKELNNVPVEVINVPAGYDVVPLPSYAKIYMKGGEKILANASVDHFKIIINFRRDWRQGVGQVPAEIKTDLKLLYVETRPAQFELIVQKK